MEVALPWRCLPFWESMACLRQLPSTPTKARDDVQLTAIRASDDRDPPPSTALAQCYVRLLFSVRLFRTEEHRVRHARLTHQTRAHRSRVMDAGHFAQSKLIWSPSRPSYTPLEVFRRTVNRKHGLSLRACVSPIVNATR